MINVENGDFETGDLTGWANPFGNNNVELSSGSNVAALRLLEYIRIMAN